MELGIIESAAPPLITFIFSLTLGLYIFKINHENLANKTFLLFMSTLAISSLLDFGQGLTRIEDLALIFAKFKYAFIIFVPIFFLHLSTALSDEKLAINYRRYIYVFYIISIIFFIITISTNFIVSGVEYKNNVYNTEYGFLNLISILFSLIVLIPGLAILIFTFKNTNNKEKKMQMKYIFYGMSISAILFILFQAVIPRLTGYDMQGTLILTIPMFFTFAYAIAKYKLLKVPKLVQEKDITSEPIEYELEPGYTYIIPEREPKKGFQLFAKMLKEGAHGICITMQDPSKIRQKYGLKKTPIISISNKKYDDLTVKPDEISSINELLKPYFENPEKSIIYLIDDKAITAGTHIEDHSKVLSMSQTFFETIGRSNSRFIISVSPGSISPKQRKEIIKTKAPLLEFTRLTAFVFEEICNNLLQFLLRNGYIKNDEIPAHLTNLSKRDSFFRNISYKKSLNPKGPDSKIKFTNILVAQRLSRQVLIDKIKLFISEFENIETAMNLNSIVENFVTKYGLSKNEFQLHIGDTYIIPDPSARKSFEIFSEFISKDFKGLCITKSNPKKLRRKFDLTKRGVKIYWLTDISEGKKDVLPPKLEHILSTIDEFLKKGSEKKIILLDGIEYLIFYSGDIFDAVLGFLRRLTDRISETNSMIIIPLDTKALSEQRITLLTRSDIEIYKPD